MVIRLIWKLFLNLKIAILLLSLNLISCVKTSQTEQTFSGNFTTAHIREYWQICSIAYRRIQTPEQIYYPLCDCAVDTMRQKFDNSTKVETMKKAQSDELATLIRLNCNEYRISGRRTK